MLHPIVVNALCAPESGFPSQAFAIEREVRRLCFGQSSSSFWFCGFWASLFTSPCLIHILLVIALIVLVINLVSGRRSVL